MNNRYVELYLHRFTEIRKFFLLDLYLYLLKNKNCIYMVLNFSKKDFQNVDTGVLDMVFKSYICKKISKYNDIPDFNEQKCENLKLSNMEIDDVMIEAIVDHYSYESLEIIQSLDWDKMMLFKKHHFDDSIVIGVYDYKTYIVISNIDNNDIIEIKQLLTNYIDASKIREITKDL